MSDSVSKNLPVTAVIVHFRTFELTRMAIWSLKTNYPDMKLIVVENHSGDGSLEMLNDLAGTLKNVSVLPMNKHVHHGPGMDAAINECVDKWILVCDSDCIVYRPHVVEAMLSKVSDKTYMIGKMHLLDTNGFFANKKTFPIVKYIHPHFALVRKEFYSMFQPFEKHGSPCLTNEIQAQRDGFELVDFPVNEYVYHIERGTVAKFGYGLGLGGQIVKFKRIINRIFWSFGK